MTASARNLNFGTLSVFLVASLVAALVGQMWGPTWTVETTPLGVQTDEDGKQSITFDGEPRSLEDAIPLEEIQLTPEELNDSKLRWEAEPLNQLGFEDNGASERSFFQIESQRHWGVWSFLPAIITIGLCWVTKEPISSLLAGIVVGALLMGQFDILGGVLIPSISTTTAATILILYLWLLGGLMGVWAKTGASQAFAEYMAKNYVRGPRSAKFVAWLLGVIFFQGGTISSVLVGTTVKPLADKERVSHEELSLIVDATSSPIAILLAFNAWPIYIQAFLGVAGVSYLATEKSRLEFFFGAVPLSFYAAFSVLATLLLALDKHPLMPRKLKLARQRARETGELNAPGSEPLANEAFQESDVTILHPATPLDFFLPLIALLGIAIGTYKALGSPNVLWAFGAALLLAACMAWVKGMTLRTIIGAVLEGQKSVILGSVILLLAITIGKISQDVGAGHYLVSLLGDFPWHWALPAAVFLIAVVIAFSTGTCWGTYAVTFPLVMPLAYAVATNQELTHPDLFMAICFAACLNGGVFGDQCSPISDTTILSSISTGADLMDHVTTQIPIALQAAGLALVLWTGMAYYCA
ncbi:Na+/H+ antiporter NhaC family protein [Adhaeretor mobilis]|uniref:Na+/H+ antiporter family protein n=1 Tax=Adhaeretor mobilis TaxID=1930276 RepID=A0A517MTR2_9BACT|nr:Na+/H+ antiporter NhaC family protein [Adhaeretor mobilis]QDS98252.1 Na+/H+ antiporter family protein [Adhaeretor mobilis]